MTSSKVNQKVWMNWQKTKQHTQRRNWEEFLKCHGLNLEVLKLFHQRMYFGRERNRNGPNVFWEKVESQRQGEKLMDVSILSVDMDTKFHSRALAMKWKTASKSPFPELLNAWRQVDYMSCTWPGFNVVQNSEIDRIIKPRSELYIEWYTRNDGIEMKISYWMEGLK